jgi:putative endonuclease
MYYTYILQSERTGKLYIGQTKNVEKRLARHNRGGTPSTQSGRPWELLYSKSFATRSEAVQLEQKLKSWKNPDRVLSCRPDFRKPTDSFCGLLGGFFIMKLLVRPPWEPILTKSLK